MDGGTGSPGSEQESNPIEKSDGKNHTPKAFLDAIPRAYASSGTLRGMLILLIEQWPKENGRAKAAMDYLDHSRYRDYETTLSYLSDSSAACETRMEEVLKKEIQKTTALTCH